MKENKLRLKEKGRLPYNYSLYPVEEIIDGFTKQEERVPVEYCKIYNAKLSVKAPYKRIVEY